MLVILAFFACIVVSMHVMCASLRCCSDRYTQIEHDNMLLLKKMHDILDHGNPTMLPHESVGPRSLNITSRKLEVARIMDENLVGLCM